MDYQQEIIKAKTVSDIFEIVKNLIRESLGAEQAGLMVGVSDLGAYKQGFIGAFYSLSSNMIIINKKPLARILQTNPGLYNYYLFHVMLHEYVHSVGSYDELQTRQLVFDVSKNYFGDEHIVTKLAEDISKFMPSLTYEENLPPEDIILSLSRELTERI